MIKRLLLLAFIIAICGCSRIPEPIGYNYSTQEKMQAAHHWDILAKDLSNKINNELIRSDFLETPIFVKETCGSDLEPCNEGETTEFDEGFRDLLITDLVNYGIPTSAIPDREAITVNYKVQSIYHSSDRVRTFRPGALTALTAFITVMRHAPEDIIAIALAATTDSVNAAFVKQSNMEVIITTSMVFRNKYIFRSSDIYYINTQDAHHYKQHKNGAKTVELISHSGF